MPKDWRSALPIVLLLVILSPIAIDVYLPSLPEMMRVFNVNDSVMQFTVSLFMICMGTGQLIAGPLSDRYGRRITALTGTVLYIIGSLVAAGSDTISTLYIARVLQGLGAASCTVTAFAWVRDHYDAIESGKWISYMGGIIGVVPTLAPLLGGMLAVQWGWSANFVFMAVLAGLIGIGCFIWIDPGAPRHIKTANKRINQSLKDNVFEILSCRQFLLYSMTGMLTMGAILSYATHAPIVAINMGGMDEFGFALLFGGLGLVKLLVSFTAPEVASCIGRRQTILIGLIIALVGAGGFLIIPADLPLWFFAPAAIGYIGFNLIFGTASGLTLESFKHCSGVAAAIDGFARMAGGGLISALLKLLGFSVLNTVATAYGLLLISFLLVMWDIANQQQISGCSGLDQPA